VSAGPLAVAAALLARVPFDPRRLPQLPDDFPAGVREALLTVALALPAVVAIGADAMARRGAPRWRRPRAGAGRGR
jgi:hypothetical protein